MLVPARFEKAISVYRHAAHEELAQPIRPSDADELRWLFEQRKRGAAEPAIVLNPRFVETAKRFSAPRFRVLYRLCARRSESRPVRRSESDPPEGGSFYVVLR